MKLDSELRVLLVFLRHADKHGIAWPSPATVAEKLGITVRNVQRAISALVARGMLTGGQPGSGRGHYLKRKIVIPENPAHGATFSGGENPAQAGAKTRRNATRKPGAGRSENPAQCAGRRDLEHHKEHTSSNNGDAAGADDGISSEGKDEEDRTLRELKVCGISGRKLRELARAPHVQALPPVALRILYLDAQAKAKTNPAGLLVRKLEDGDLPDVALTADLFCRLVNEGHIVSVKGKAVTNAFQIANDIYITLGDGTRGRSPWDHVRQHPMELSTTMPRALSDRERILERISQQKSADPSDNGFVPREPDEEDLRIARTPTEDEAFYERQSKIKPSRAPQRGMVENLKL